MYGLDFQKGAITSIIKGLLLGLFLVYFWFIFHKLWFILNKLSRFIASILGNYDK